MIPFLFILAINCKVDIVLCKGETNLLIEAKGFSHPLRTPTFPKRRLGASAPKNPATIWTSPRCWGVWAGGVILNLYFVSACIVLL